MAKVEAKVSSLRAFAKRHRVTENAVRKAVASGRLKASLGRNAKGKPFIANVTRADSEWEQNAGRPAPAQIAKVISQDTLVAAQRSATLERSRKLKLDNDLKEGMLVEVATVKLEWFNAGRTIRKAIQNIPSRLSAELAAESDPRRVYSKLESALREALNTLADAVEAVAQ